MTTLNRNFNGYNIIVNEKLKRLGTSHAVDSDFDTLDEEIEELICAREILLEEEEW